MHDEQPRRRGQTRLGRRACRVAKPAIAPNEHVAFQDLHRAGAVRVHRFGARKLRATASCSTPRTSPAAGATPPKSASHMTT